MGCADCKNWIMVRATLYANGEEIVNWTAPEGKGECAELKIVTDPDFSCAKHAYGVLHVDVTRKSGAPWSHFKMIPCPDCAGIGDGARGHRCAGTGLVRLYDDGYIGDEQTRLHPKEKPEPSKCLSCGQPTDPAWAHCPACGAKALAVAETEMVDDALAGLPPPEESK